MRESQIDSETSQFLEGLERFWSTNLSHNIPKLILQKRLKLVLEGFLCLVALSRQARLPSHRTNFTLANKSELWSIVIILSAVSQLKTSNLSALEHYS